MLTLLYQRVNLEILLTLSDHSLQSFLHLFHSFLQFFPSSSPFLLPSSPLLSPFLLFFHLFEPFLLLFLFLFLTRGWITTRRRRWWTAARWLTWLAWWWQSVILLALLIIWWRQWKRDWRVVLLVCRWNTFFLLIKVFPTLFIIFVICKERVLRLRV